MSSRRVMQRSYSGEERSGIHNGDDVSRPASRSYLSNVRPESRSTLCSVMAQLTEETQPTFEVTLKSRAVSEKCKVTFTCEVRGHPVPQVIWYKDDVQLDRYCGLPNCTMEDAAIYQASASNVKGIVSCSGVLEVGLMNEYLIHQRYFAKLKQKAEGRCRELEGLENREALRNLSPDRSQRKRRSPMAPHFAAEEASSATTAGECHEVPGPGAESVAEARLQDSTGTEEKVEKPVPFANGTSAVVPVAKRHVGVPESAGEGISPFVKKKIKISNGFEDIKEDGAQAEGPTEERRSGVRACETQALTEMVKIQGPSKEIMEIESSVPFAPRPGITDPVQRSITEAVQNVDKTPSEESKICLDRAGGRLQVTGIPTPKEKLVPNSPTVNVPSAVSLRKRQGVHGAEGKPGAPLPQERAKHGDTKNKNVLESRSQKSPPKVPPASRRQATHVATPPSVDTKQKVGKGSHVPPTGDMGPVRHKATELQIPSTRTKPRTGLSVETGSPSVRPLERSDSAHPEHWGTTGQRCPTVENTEDAFPRSSRELQGREKETSHRPPENGSVSEPQQLAEATRAHGRPNRAAPVDLKPPPPRCATDSVSPQRTEEEAAAAAGGPKPGAHRPVQGTGRNTRDHSRGSSERNLDPLTDPATFPEQSLGHGQSGPQCSVHQASRGPGVPAVKTEEVVNIPLGRNVEEGQAGTALLCEKRRPPSQRKVEMEAGVDVKGMEHAQIGAALNESQNETDFITHAGVPHTEINYEPLLRPMVETHPIPHRTNITGVDTSNQQVTKEPGNLNVPDTNGSEQRAKPLKEAHTPEPNILSVAEIMSQVKALDSTVSNPLTVESNSVTVELIASPSLFGVKPGRDMERALAIEIQKKIETKPQEQPLNPTAPSNGAMTSFSRGEDLRRQLNEDRTIETEMEPQMDTETSVSTPEVPDTMAKELERRINQQPSTECTPDQLLTPTAPTSEAMVSFSIPPIYVSDTESIAETGNSYGGVENDSIMDTGHECGKSSPVSSGVNLDAASAAATDGNNTITCCSDALLMEVDSKVLADSNVSVIGTQEHGKSLSSVETGLDSAQLCCTADGEKGGLTLEQNSPKPLHGTDEGFKQIPPPEIKLNSESNWNSTPVLSTTCVDAQKTPELNTIRVETKQEDKIQPERNLCISVVEPPATTTVASESPSSSEEAPLQEAKSNSLTFPSATLKDLALGARRKILTPKSTAVEDDPIVPSPVDGRPRGEEVLPKSSEAPPDPATLSVPPGPSQQPLLAVEPSGQPTPPARRRSPLLSRKVTAQETPAAGKEALEQTRAPEKSQQTSAEKEKHDPFKAPQVIRKIRGESFSDASGHLKLWCQFFNVLSDSVISWYRDDVEVAQVKRSAGDETPFNLAIIQASKKDCGVYGCKITNAHGTDITDHLLSVEILGGMRLREDLGVGEEIEMTPLVLSKGVADHGAWGSKFFGRVMVQESHVGGGCSRKTWRATVVYGLEPVFQSGSTCVIKMCNRITYGGKGEAQLTERNVELEREASSHGSNESVHQCRIQSLAREYCKIFSAESRAIENFGPCLEVIPVYLMYRPANTIPYATVEADLQGVYLRYCKLSAVAGLVSRTGSEVALKCCALQHWIHQWTNGNLLFTQMEGVDNKLTNVGISVRSTGYQGLSAVGTPDVLEQFVSQHQCNYYCGLLGLRSLKAPAVSLQTPSSSKSKGSKSPSLQRKTAAAAHSPQTARRAAVSPRLPRRAEDDSLHLNLRHLHRRGQWECENTFGLKFKESK
ncbi:hypothetical protein NHX12_006466 [Muraenolepis orangiensis]|uniref:non-specific serine/threonine protein kinase n=1 Tax=Muraenolepis orangiensis TaxID=630683 RepID=A0A9Q0DTB6_9TELE|nr:hypothetical protein NHX12_006466 [Muraenolepis orangiensis]